MLQHPVLPMFAASLSGSASSQAAWLRCFAFAVASAVQVFCSVLRELVLKDAVVGTPVCSWQRPCLDGGCNPRRLQAAVLRLANEDAVIVGDV